MERHDTEPLQRGGPVYRDEFDSLVNRVERMNSEMAARTHELRGRIDRGEFMAHAVMSGRVENNTRDVIRLSEEIKMLATRDQVSTLIKTVENMSRQMDMLSKKFVTVEAFAPVRAVVYGLIGLILAGVITAILTVIIKGKP